MLASYIIKKSNCNWDKRHCSWDKRHWSGDKNNFCLPAVWPLVTLPVLVGKWMSRRVWGSQVSVIVSISSASSYTQYWWGPILPIDESVKCQEFKLWTISSWSRQMFAVTWSILMNIMNGNIPFSHIWLSLQESQARLLPVQPFVELRHIWKCGKFDLFQHSMLDCAGSKIDSSSSRMDAVERKPIGLSRAVSLVRLSPSGNFSTMRTCCDWLLWADASQL